MRIYRAHEAASRLGISKQTLLRYEKKGIFPPAKRNRINLWREYTQEDIENFKQRLNKGITLIELIIVVIIMAILAVTAIPRLRGFETIKISGAAKSIASDIRYVQQVAVSRHTRTRLIFDTIADNYTADEESPADSGNWVKIISPFTRGELTVDYKTHPLYSGTNIDSADFGGAGNLTFNWTGSPLYAGSVAVSLRGSARSVSVENETGMVKVQ